MRKKNPKPRLLISSNVQLFNSFFSPEQQGRLSHFAGWQRHGARSLNRTLRRQLREVQGLITTWDSPPYFGEALLEWAPNLKMISHCGAAVKGRFALPLFERLVITNAPSPMTQHVAELAVAFLLYLAREVDDYRAKLRGTSNAIYQQIHLSGGGDQTILGREIGLIGLGRIGRAIVDLLIPFGTRFRVYDPFIESRTIKNLPVQMDSLENVLSRSRYLILAAGLTEDTRGMLSRKRLGMLPRGAAVINVARGGLLDLEALTEKVVKRRLRCALDVTDPDEPLPLEHPLRKAPGAILTPHVGAISGAVRHEIAEIIMADLERFFHGKPVENRVTPEMLGRMT
jgi:phosphoglycerate dehydrogenase-like enzyme